MGGARKIVLSRSPGKSARGTGARPGNAHPGTCRRAIFVRDLEVLERHVRHARAPLT